MTKEKKPKAQEPDTLTLPLLLGPLVTIELCDKQRVSHGQQKRRNSVVDASDGREWVVQWEGDVLVAQKTGQSAGDQQAFSQYERLRQSLATASHRAQAYAEAFEGQKKNDAPALTEASRAEVDRIIAQKEEAQALFDAFEQEHPECLRKRIVGEAHAHRTVSTRYRLEAEKYERAVAEWQTKHEEVKANTGKPDDHITEQMQACQAQADEWRRKQELEDKAVSSLEREASKLPESVATVERYEVSPGQPVCFQ